MLKFFSQRDKQWANHPLGWGGKVGTIGAYGCYVTVCSMIAWACGLHYTPPMIDALGDARKVYKVDPTGTNDFLPDNALDQLFPGHFKTLRIAGFAKAQLAAAIAAPDTYAYVHISTASVPTHFIWMLGTDAEADPWWGARGSLSGYGGPGAVEATYIVRFLDPGLKAAAALAAATAAKASAAAQAASSQAALQAAQAAKAAAVAAAAAVAEAQAAAATAAATARPVRLPTPPPAALPASPWITALVGLIRSIRELFR